MAKDWPGITNKKAFCAWLTHEQTGKWPAEKSIESGAFSLRLPVAKYDEQSGVVTGWAALSSADNKPLIDYHDELLLVSELEKAAHGLMLDGGAGKAGEMHETRVGDVVESMVLSKEKVAALLGIESKDVKQEGWAVSMKIRDEGARERVRSGERPELSIYGLAKKIPVGERDGRVVKALVDLSVDEISLVDQGASGNKDASPKIVIAKRREQSPAGKPGLAARFLSQVRKLFGKENTMNLDEILAKLTEEERAFLLAELERMKATPAAPEANAPAPAVAEPAIKAEEEMTEEEQAKVMKSLPEPLRKQLEAANTTKEEVAKLRKEIDERNEREEVAKFRAKATDLPFLAGKSTEEIAKALRAAFRAMKPKEYETIEKLLSDANEAVKGSPLFQDEGGPGHEAEATAKGQIESIAKRLRESDAKLSRAESITKALDENKELHQRYVREMREG